MPSFASSVAKSLPKLATSASRFSAWPPWRALLQPAGLVAEGSPLLGLADVQAAHVLDVRSGGEGLLARAGQDDHPRTGVVGEFPQPVAQLGQRREIEGVQRVLTVDRDDGDAGIERYRDAHAATLSRRKSTISLVGAPGVKTAATPCPLS